MRAVKSISLLAGVARRWASKHPARAVAVLLGVLALYHAFFALFGLDFSDEGFYMTFYAHVFSHPDAVEYNYMYYLTGLAGGAVHALMPWAGLLGMRWAGVAVMVCAAWVCWLLLRRHVPAGALLTGLALVIAGYVNRPYALGNAMCTALLYAVAFVMLKRGIATGKWWWTALAGAVCGMNVFVRIPNVLTAGMVLLPVIACCYGLLSRRRAAWSCVAFIAGMVCGVLGVLALQVPLGHSAPFVRNMTQLFGIFNVADATASHSTSSLLQVPALLIVDVSKRLLLFGAMLWLWRMVRRRVDKPAVLWAIATVLGLGCLALIWRTLPVHLLWCLSVAGGVMVLRAWDDTEVKLLVWMGLFMLLVFPLGSDTFNNQGTLIALVAAPLGVMGLRRLPESKWVLPMLMAVFVARMLAGGSFTDGGSFIGKSGVVDAPQVAAIHTQPARAAAINAGLQALRGHVCPGDTLMVWGDSPMLNYLTETLPYHGNSWPGLLNEPMLRDYLQGGRPKILVQKYRNGDYWDDRPYKNIDRPGIDATFASNAKLIAVHDFMVAHHYRRTVETDHYALFEP